MVGGGLAGVGCCRELARRGGVRRRVALLEQRAELGGRCASRVAADAKAWSFDTGAVYVAAKRPTSPFAEAVAEAAAADAVAEWSGELAAVGRCAADGALDAASVAPLPAKQPRLVGTPTWSALPEAVLGPHVEAGAVLVATQTRVTGIERAEDGGWKLSLRVRDGGHVWYPPPLLADVVLVCMAAPGVRSFARAAGLNTASDPAEGVGYDATWALSVAFDERVDACGLDGVAVTGPDGSAIAWAGRTSSKPGRPQGADCWDVHASAAWSNARLDARPSDVADALLADFRALMQVEAAPTHCSATLWKAAFPTNPAEEPYFDAEEGWGAVGDWALGPRGADAFDAGAALGRLVAESVPVTNDP